MMKTYTAEEVSQITKEGFDIIKRTVNYYALKIC